MQPALVASEASKGAECMELTCHLMASEDGDSGWQTTSVEIHARSAVLKTLSSQTSLPKKLEVYQMYPLSFEDPDVTDRTATMEEFVSDLEQVRLYTGAAAATIVGHSMGAAVALSYAVRDLMKYLAGCTTSA